MVLCSLFVSNMRQSVDQKTSNDLLDILCRYIPHSLHSHTISLLEPLASHRLQHNTNTPRKRKRRKMNPSTDNHPLFLDPPPLVSSMTIGFNPTTEHLESEINGSSRRMRVVFVARGDTSSTHLYAHFPLMVSMLPNIRLVSLAKGAERRLCETLELKRVGVIGLMVTSL
jgi:RNase P subunit Pop3